MNRIIYVLRLSPIIAAGALVALVVFAPSALGAASERAGLVGAQHSTAEQGEAGRFHRFGGVVTANLAQSDQYAVRSGRGASQINEFMRLSDFCTELGGPRGGPAGSAQYSTEGSLEAAEDGTSSGSPGKPPIGAGATFERELTCEGQIGDSTVRISQSQGRSF